MKIILLILALVALVGCSYTRSIGTVGSKRFTKVQLGSLTAPGQTLLVIEDTNTHEVIITQPMGGNGMVPSLVQAGGIAGAAAALGNSLDRDHGDRTVVRTDVSNQIEVTDEAPAPPIVPPVKPPKPPKNRPPDNRPPHKGWR